MATPDPTRAAPVAETPWRAVRRNLGWMLASRGVLAILSLVYLAFATRALGVTGFGRFALITAAAQTLATLVAFQTWQVIVQFGVAPAERGDEAALGRLFRGGVLLDFAGAAVGVALAWLLLELFAERLDIGPTLKRATFIFTAVQIIAARSALLGLLRLRGRFADAALADSVTPVMRLIGGGAIFLFHPTVQGFLFAWGLAELLTATAYWAMIARSGDLRLLRHRGTIRGLLAEHPGMLRFALSTNATATLSMSSKQLSLLLAGALVSPAAAGIFRLATQLAQGMGKVSQLVSRAAYPEVVKSLAHASAGTLRTVIWRLLAASGAGAAAILAFTALAGKPVLLLVGGRAFGDAWPVLVWLAAAASIDFATVGLETLLTALKRTGTIFTIRCVGAAMVVAGAIAMAPRFGAFGVACAVAAASAVSAALMVGAALRMPRRARLEEAMRHG